MDDLEALQAKIADMQRQADVMLIQKKTEVIADIKIKIETYSLTAQDLGLTAKRSSMAGIPVPIKYRHGEHTWTGRGRQPQWLVDYIAAGNTLESVQI